MSVRLFTQQEIVNLASELKARGYVKDMIIYSRAYQKDRLLTMQFKKESFLRSPEQVGETIDRLLWYCFQANQLAYALQYPDAKDETQIADWKDEIKPDIPTRKTLDVLHEISNLRYNLYTNNGNCFLGRDWHDLLDRTIETLKDEIIRLYEQLQQHRSVVYG
jgi:hypothetical protein